MTHAYRPNFSPKTPPRGIKIPAPPSEALKDPEAADKWFNAATEKAGEILYRDRPGMPNRAPHDSQVLATAYAAEPVSKTWMLSILTAAGQLPHIAGGKPVSTPAKSLLLRLVAFIAYENCQEGNFRIQACNKTISQEIGRCVRSIRRYFSELQDAGWLYRHTTTGPQGVQRESIDLGPTAYRLKELEDIIADRAGYRAEVRDQRKRCATISTTPTPPKTKESGGEDKNDLQNTNDSKFIFDSVNAHERSVAGQDCGKPPKGADGKGFYHPQGRPEFTPKPSLVVDKCPTLASYVSSISPNWQELISAAYAISARWQMNETVWKTLCHHLGREWAAIAVATVAEMPDSKFTRSKARTPELRKAGYTAGIARKLSEGKPASVAATWFRHLAQKSPGHERRPSMQ